MMKKSLLLFGVAMLAVAGPLCAQGGCVNSPENPTLVLALVGSASAFVAGARGRWKARRRNDR